MNGLLCYAMFKGLEIWWTIALLAAMAFIVEEDFRKYPKCYRIA